MVVLVVEATSIMARIEQVMSESLAMTPVVCAIEIG
jgi:hypothetical protein